MRGPRYEVGSGHGAWGPDPEGMNRIINAVHHALSLTGNDRDRALVQAKLDELASPIVQEKYKLFVKEVPQFADHV